MHHFCLLADLMSPMSVVVFQVNGEEITLLVPFADLANHAARPDIRFDYEELASAFVLRSVTKLEAGTEVGVST